MARFTGCSAGCAARVRTDLVAGRVLVALLVAAGAEAYSRGARMVGWRRVSCAAGLGGAGIGRSSMKGFDTPPLHEGQALVQPVLQPVEELREEARHDGPFSA